ncbi:MAG TPA: ATP-dependent 6-phosphofructokinase [Candidatus Methylomirabilis sp.]|nr:ATP-dependent 6-phosphofructokinase [Candidatus Methylomirabilis sp.]
MRRIGILTGGGDCPGLNAVIRAVVRKAVGHHGLEVLGIREGWLGLMTGDLIPLGLDDISGILPKGGTVLRTSRTNPFKKEDGPRRVLETLQAHRLDALIPVGGEDTLGVALKFAAQGVNLVGIPKTIDNDLDCTDYTFGFDTAVTTATDAIDRLHTTAESHHRVMVVEVMGRHAGWIATVAGIAGGADCILVPEIPFDIEEVCELVQKRKARGKDFSIVVVAEGAKPKGSGVQVTTTDKVDAFGHVRLGGIGTVVSEEIERRTGLETRVTILGHVQRGGSPTPFDRVLATRFGIKAVDLVLAGDFGKMVALQGNRIVAVPLADAVKHLKTLDMELYEIARVFFG